LTPEYCKICVPSTIGEELADNFNNNLNSGNTGGNKTGPQFPVPPKNLPKTKAEYEAMLERAKAAKTAGNIPKPPPLQPKDNYSDKKIEQLVNTKAKVQHQPQRLKPTREKYLLVPRDINDDDERLQLTPHERALVQNAALNSRKIKRMLTRVKHPYLFSGKWLISPRFRRSARIPTPLWGQMMEEVREARAKLILKGKPVARKQNRKRPFILFFVIFSILSLLGATTFGIITIINQPPLPQVGYIALNEEQFGSFRVNNYEPGETANIDVLCMNMSQGGQSDGKVALRFFMYIALPLPPGVQPTPQQQLELEELLVTFVLPDASSWIAGTVMQNGMLEACMYFARLMEPREVVKLITGFKVTSRHGGVFAYNWENQRINVTIEAQALEPSLNLVNNIWSDAPLIWKQTVGLKI